LKYKLCDLNNIRLYIIFVLIIILTLYSCSKETLIEDVPKINQSNDSIINPYFYQFTVGNYDSASYYLYQPSLDLTYQQNYPGYYGDVDSFDVDLNNTKDIALRIYGFADGFISGNTNFIQLELFNLNNYEFVCDNNNMIDTLNIGDTLHNGLNWINQNSFLLWYSEPLTNNGNWGIGYNRKYVGFRKINNDTIMGWFSLEGTSENGVALRITDCAIENP